MRSSAGESGLEVRATAVVVTDESIAVDLADGRRIVVPTVWYPRLRHATEEERANYEIDPYGIAWPDIEADFSIRGLLMGYRSGENPHCFRFWLANRKKGRRVTVIDWLKRRKRSPATSGTGKG